MQCNIIEFGSTFSNNSFCPSASSTPPGMNDESIESATGESERIFKRKEVVKHTFLNFVDCDVVEVYLLSVGTECILEITEEVFPDGNFSTSLHEGVVSVHAAT